MPDCKPQLVADRFEVTAARAGGEPEPMDEAVTIQIAYPVAIDAPVAEILDGKITGRVVVTLSDEHLST